MNVNMKTLIEKIWNGLTMDEKRMFIDSLVEQSEIIVFNRRKAVIYDESDIGPVAINGRSIQITV